VDKEWSKMEVNKDKPRSVWTQKFKSVKHDKHLLELALEG
jgi:hypothetical protein